MNMRGDMKNMKKQEKKFDKRIFKKSPEEVTQYQMFKRRGFVVENKKGKGSYKRKDKYGRIDEQDKNGLLVKW